MGGCDCQFSSEDEKSSVNFKIFIFFLNLVKKEKKKKDNCFLRNAQSPIINDSTGETREEKIKMV